MLDAYYEMEKQRAKEGLPPLPLTPAEVEEVCKGLETVDKERGAKLRGLLENRVSPGVDPAAKVKADWLAAVGKGTIKSPAVSRQDAVAILGTMLGGYNVGPLVEALSDPSIAAAAAEALKKTILVYGHFETVAGLAATNPHAKAVLESWAAGEWFLSRPAFPEKLVLKVFKVDGEINTDDFSPAGDAPTRPDIPVHAQSMGRKRFPGGNETMKKFREEGHRVAFVGDVVGTGSSRKSACNSLMWHIGEDIPFVPNKRRAGVVIGGLIAPIFFNTAEDSGGLPLMADVTGMKTGDIITLDFAAGAILVRRLGAPMETLRDGAELLLDAGQIAQEPVGQPLVGRRPRQAVSVISPGGPQQRIPARAGLDVRRDRIQPRLRPAQNPMITVPYPIVLRIVQHADRRHLLRVRFRAVRLGQPLHVFQIHPDPLLQPLASLQIRNRQFLDLCHSSPPILTTDH